MEVELAYLEFLKPTLAECADALGDAFLNLQLRLAFEHGHDRRDLVGRIFVIDCFLHRL